MGHGILFSFFVDFPEVVENNSDVILQKLMKKIYVASVLVFIGVTETSQSAVIFAGLDTSSSNIVDDRNDSLATSYSGTWEEEETGATGSWSLDITYTGRQDLTWQSNAGESISIGTNTTSGALFIDFFSGDDPITMVFDMEADLGYSLIDVTYSVGPSLNTSHSDWGSGMINTGGTEVALSTYHANYDSDTGYIRPSSQRNSRDQDWYIAFDPTDAITLEGNVYRRDTHAFGTSGIIVVPEPSSAMLLALGGLALIVKRRRFS